MQGTLGNSLPRAQLIIRVRFNSETEIRASIQKLPPKLTMCPSVFLFIYFIFCYGETQGDILSVRVCHEMVFIYVTVHIRFSNCVCKRSSVLARSGVPGVPRQVDLEFAFHARSRGLDSHRDTYPIVIQKHRKQCKSDIVERL